MPTQFGHWHRIYARYDRWAKKEIWTLVFKAISDDPDFENLFIDGSIVRVHQHGASKKLSVKSSRKVEASAV